MTAMPLCFDAVLFDLDGTLVATDRFWPDAARQGTLRAFAELGIERELPTRLDWMSMVGHEIGAGFARVFPDLTPDQRQALLDSCTAAEDEALRAGGAVLLPGVQEALTALAARGVDMGIASNCGQGYLSAMYVGLGLDRWIAEPRCLDTPGISNKADMIEDLLHTFGTRRAVMVGDRAGDRDAAWENGVPHMHLARGYALAGESVECEATLEGFDELIPILSRRATWIADALRRVGLTPAAKALGVTGRSASGKSLFAGDVVRVLASEGRTATCVSLDDFLRDSGARCATPPDAQDHLTFAFDVEALIRDVLEPHSRGADVSVQTPTGARIDVSGADLLVLEGVFLLHPALRVHLDRVLYLDVHQDVIQRRAAGRDGRLHGPEAFRRILGSYLPAQQAFEELYPPAARADWVLSGSNALGALLDGE
jgi:phosphoglycolate phosphatase